jgi:hypothetical protein
MTNARHLTGFEFISIVDEPQLVRVRQGETVILEFMVTDWVGVFVPTHPPIFHDDEELTIEGRGLGRPYWDQAPPWAGGTFDATAEAARIEQIRRAALEMDRRGGSILAMQ